MKRVALVLAVIAVVLSGCKTGEDLVLPNQSSAHYVSTR